MGRRIRRRRRGRKSKFSFLLLKQLYHHITPEWDFSFRFALTFFNERLASLKLSCLLQEYSSQRSGPVIRAVEKPTQFTFSNKTSSTNSTTSSAEEFAVIPISQLLYMPLVPCCE